MTSPRSTGLLLLLLLLLLPPAACGRLQAAARPAAAPHRPSTVTLRRIGLYRAGARYVGKNDCRSVDRILVELGRGVEAISIMRPGESVRRCGDPRASATLATSGVIEGARLFGEADAPPYLVGCVRGTALPAVIALRVQCRE